MGTKAEEIIKLVQLVPPDVVGVAGEAFSEWLRRERKVRGWTQENAAAAFGVSLGSVRNWERGNEDGPDFENWVRVCIAFGRRDLVPFLEGRTTGRNVSGDEEGFPEAA